MLKDEHGNAVDPLTGEEVKWARANYDYDQAKALLGARVALWRKALIGAAGVLGALIIIGNAMSWAAKYVGMMR